MPRRVSGRASLAGRPQRDVGLEVAVLEAHLGLRREREDHRLRPSVVAEHGRVERDDASHACDVREAPEQKPPKAAALQFVRKVSGYRVPSRANAHAFDEAVVEVTAASRRLLDGLRPGARA